MSALDYSDIVYEHASPSTSHHTALHFMTGDKFSTYHCFLYEKAGWCFSSTLNHNILHVLYVWNNVADLTSDQTCPLLVFSPSRVKTLVACRQTESGLEIDLFLTWHVSVSERERVDETGEMERW